MVGGVTGRRGVDGSGREVAVDDVLARGAGRAAGVAAGEIAFADAGVATAGVMLADVGVGIATVGSLAAGVVTRDVSAIGVVVGTTIGGTFGVGRVGVLACDRARASAIGLRGGCGGDGGVMLVGTGSMAADRGAVRGAVDAIGVGVEMVSAAETAVDPEGEAYAATSTPQSGQVTSVAEMVAPQ